jgi:hypothetical protein
VKTGLICTSEINAQVKQAYSKVMSGEMEREDITKMRLLQNQEQERIYGIMH